ncbi:MAG: hypothetical protein QOJ01_2245, partial [Solirubrobacterales bacterium]|nr:hypothetical protein [Solirubrobacterales bacterium]
EVDLVVKLDTDALVLGPFAAELARTFAGDPGLGVVGRYRLGAYGDRRDFRPAAGAVLRAALPFRVYRRDGRRHVVLPAPRQTLRVHSRIWAARRHGYQLGEHCLGGVYAVSGALLGALAADGALERPDDWTASGLSEDHLVGLLARAAGFSLDDSPLFGASLEGLPAPPAKLVADGFAFTHSVKGDREAELRAEFAALKAVLPSR